MSKKVIAIILIQALIWGSIAQTAAYACIRSTLSPQLMAQKPLLMSAFEQKIDNIDLSKLSPYQGADRNYITVFKALTSHPELSSKISKQGISVADFSGSIPVKYKSATIRKRLNELVKKGFLSLDNSKRENRYILTEQGIYGLNLINKENSILPLKETVLIAFYMVAHESGNYVHGYLNDISSWVGNSYSDISIRNIVLEINDLKEEFRNEVLEINKILSDLKYGKDLKTLNAEEAIFNIISIMSRMYKILKKIEAIVENNNFQDKKLHKGIVGSWEYWNYLKNQIDMLDGKIEITEINLGDLYTRFDGRKSMRGLKDSSAGLYSVKAWKKGLQFVISNIRKNMLEHSNANSYTERVYANDYSVFIEITDNGIGFDLDKLRKKAVELDFWTKEEALENSVATASVNIDNLREKKAIDLIFKKGFTGRDNPTSTNGLGLWLCRQIIEKYCNGTIEAENVYKKVDENAPFSDIVIAGAKFTIKIPQVLFVESDLRNIPEITHREHERMNRKERIQNSKGLDKQGKPKRRQKSIAHAMHKRSLRPGITNRKTYTYTNINTPAGEDFSMILLNKLAEDEVLFLLAQIGCITKELIAESGFSKYDSSLLDIAFADLVRFGYLNASYVFEGAEQLEYFKLNPAGEEMISDILLEQTISQSLKLDIPPYERKRIPDKFQSQYRKRTAWARRHTPKKDQYKKPKPSIATLRDAISIMIDKGYPLDNIYKALGLTKQFGYLNNYYSQTGQGQQLTDFDRIQFKERELRNINSKKKNDFPNRNSLVADNVWDDLAEYIQDVFISGPKSIYLFDQLDIFYKEKKGLNFQQWEKMPWEQRVLSLGYKTYNDPWRGNGIEFSNVRIAKTLAGIIDGTKQAFSDIKELINDLDKNQLHSLFLAISILSEGEVSLSILKEAYKANIQWKVNNSVAISSMSDCSPKNVLRYIELSI